MIAGGVLASIKISQRGIVVVQTGKVVREDLTSLVTASGEIKPKNYINIGANQLGPLTAIYVKEGDKVKKGQLLAEIESVDARADVKAQQAALNSALADSAASEANEKAGDDNIKALAADVDRNKADHATGSCGLSGERRNCFKAQLIARQDFDAKKAAYDGAVAAVQGSVRPAVAGEGAASASRGPACERPKERGPATGDAYKDEHDLQQIQRIMRRLDGVVTNLPVRVGETVVPGIQSSTASTIMTIADMSQITAEVHVDETDIVSVALGQIGRRHDRRNPQPDL